MITNSTLEEDTDYFGLVLSYLPFVVIAIGVIGNTSAFLVFVTNKHLRKISSIVILSFIVVSDTFSLFIWNLDHFYNFHFGTYYEFTQLWLCRLMLFIQYLSLQSSAWLLSFLCFDRFIAVMSTPGSIYKRLPFGTPKTAVRWSILIIAFFMLFNSHILMFNGFYDPPTTYNITMTELVNGTLKKVIKQQVVQSSDTHCGTYTTGFKFFLTWDIVQVYVYSFIPALIMLTFNTLIGSNINHNPNNQQAIKSFRKKRRLSITLIVITIAFVVMTLPSTIVWGFFGNYDPSSVLVFVHLGGLFDFISFLNHGSVFILTFLSNVKFRKVVLNIFCCANDNSFLTVHKNEKRSIGSLPAQSSTQTTTVNKTKMLEKSN